MTTRIVLALAALAVAIGPRPQVAGQEPAVRMVADEGEALKYWPRWRGPSGQGLAMDAGYVDVWSPTQNVVWKTPLAGRGNSSPIVWRDQIVFTTAYDDGRRLAVVSYRRTDGAKLWETLAPQGPTDDEAHFKNGHASATPATDGERIYGSFGSRGLFALDMAGKILWHRDLAPSTPITVRPDRRSSTRAA
jgi:outer membrane protein assembly factor BamB